MVERAVLAGGCFWGMQDLIRRMSGVTATRVGYSGGDIPNATYRNHGTHAEAIEIMFDPDLISYRRLLEFFSRSTIRPRRTGRATTSGRAIGRRSISWTMRRSRSRWTRSRMWMPPASGRAAW